MHGALFERETGASMALCGQGMTPIAVAIVDGQVVLMMGDAPAPSSVSCQSIGGSWRCR